MDLEACLPPDLRSPTTTITRIAAGWSGAGVYRVEAGGQTYVLKIASDAEWRRKLEILRLAAAAGLAPRVVHVDDARRAVVSAFVVDRSFPAYYLNPGTHDAALVALAQTVRRVHQLPLPDGGGQDPRQLLAATWSGLAGFTVPAFVGDAVTRVLAEDPPATERAQVLSHNDVNPTNLVFDGEHLLLLDWDAAGPNDPFYDLATIAVFLRMDEATCLRLLAAYDGQGSPALPARFGYDRRLVAVLCGATFLGFARLGGHAGGDGELASTPGLDEVYQRMRSGSLSPATPEGQWWFGLALVKAGASGS